jgi:hypothetical protein
MCTSTLSPSRLFPIVGALSSCGISYGSEAATGLDSNEMSYSPLKWAGTARRILVARLCERPGNKLSPCDLDQNTRSKERTGLLRVQQSFSGYASVPNVIPQALRLCGVTGNLADHRFEQNKKGYQSGWAVTKYDVRRCPGFTNISGECLQVTRHFLVSCRRYIAPYFALTTRWQSR